jgi:DHA1 family bicyclomycin/chloramphenicol resistance-like MFS transporter
LLALRFIQGIGAASTRVIAVSIVRDRFGGRAMAEVMSLIFMVFMIIPVIAPGIGQLVLMFGDWHMIFLVMAGIALAITSLAWLRIRLPETQHPEDRRSIDIGSVFRGFGIVLTNRVSLCYTLSLDHHLRRAVRLHQLRAAGLCRHLRPGRLVPVVFAGIAGMMALSSFLNSRLVGTVGMRRLSHGALLGFLTVSAVWLVWSLTGPVPLPALHRAVCCSDVPVRLDRLELQRHLDGAARPHRRHGGLGSGLHPDAGRRSDRR